MISKKEIRELVDLLISKTGKTQEEIAVDLGYAKNAISDILSPSGKVTEKFSKALNRYCSDNMDNPNNTKKRGTFELNEYLSRLEERIILLEATREVMGEKIAEILHDTSSVPISKVLTDLDREIKDRYRTRFDELKAKR